MRECATRSEMFGLHRLTLAYFSYNHLNGNVENGDIIYGERLDEENELNRKPREGEHEGDADDKLYNSLLVPQLRFASRSHGRFLHIHKER